MVFIKVLGNTINPGWKGGETVEIPDATYTSLKSNSKTKYISKVTLASGASIATPDRNRWSTLEKIDDWG